MKSHFSLTVVNAKINWLDRFPLGYCNTSTCTCIWRNNETWYRYNSTLFHKSSIKEKITVNNWFHGVAFHGMISVCHHPENTRASRCLLPR
jgi:hypothetical protein